MESSDAPSIDDIDFTGGKTLIGEFAAELKQQGIVLAVADVRDSVRRELKRYGVTDIIGAGRIFDSVQAAVDAFHADAPATHDG